MINIVTVASQGVCTNPPPSLSLSFIDISTFRDRCPRDFDFSYPTFCETGTGTCVDDSGGGGGGYVN